MIRDGRQGQNKELVCTRASQGAYDDRLRTERDRSSSEEAGQKREQERNCRVYKRS